MKAELRRGNFYFYVANFSLLVSHASSQYVETHPTPEPDLFEDEEDETVEEILSSPDPNVPVEPPRPPLNRAVQVDALLENWRTQIRNAGMETEEIFIDAI